MNKRLIRDITDFIFMSDVPKKSDVIFIPGSSKSVICEKAAQLYKDGYARYCLPSGMYSSKYGRFASEFVDNPCYMGEYATEFDYCKQVLVENGVPENAILREDRATNSMENAEYSFEVLKDMGIKVTSGIICCQAFHARRAFMSYANYFCNAQLFVVPSVTQGIAGDDWYKTEHGYKKVMGEVEKCGMYFKDIGQNFVVTE